LLRNSPSVIDPSSCVEEPTVRKNTSPVSYEAREPDLCRQLAQGSFPSYAHKPSIEPEWRVYFPSLSRSASTTRPWLRQRWARPQRGPAPSQYYPKTPTRSQRPSAPPASSTAR